MAWATGMQGVIPIFFEPAYVYRLNTYCIHLIDKIAIGQLPLQSSPVCCSTSGESDLSVIVRLSHFLPQYRALLAPHIKPTITPAAFSLHRATDILLPKDDSVQICCDRDGKLTTSTMYFPHNALCISSLLMATVSAGTPASFEIPGGLSGTAAAPGVVTTTVYETSTHYLTSAITLTSVPVSASATVSDMPANSSMVVTSSCTSSLPVESTPTPSVSLFVSGNMTFVPVTLWEGSTTRVIFPQNSTSIAIPTGYPANDTASVNATSAVGISTVVLTTSVSKTATTSNDKSSSTASGSASVSEVPVNGAVAGKIAGNAVLGLGAVAGLMALL